jgi:branched-chain amino acid aminotransferase
LKIEKTSKFLQKPDFDQKLPFGLYHTDHMLEVDYDSRNGWGKPYISPYHSFQIDPRNSTLHYGIEIFEGMKAYRNNNRLYLFRPEKNMERMIKSAGTVCLPVNYIFILDI